MCPLPIHNRSHSLDLIIAHSLKASVVDVDTSDHLSVFFKVRDCTIKELPERTIKKHCLQPEVAPNVISHRENYIFHITRRFNNSAFQ